MEISELVRGLLVKRGVATDEDIAAFLNPDYDAHCHDPILLNDMPAALARFFAALEKNERIAIYADYDCDGIGGAVVLGDFFRKIGYENFETYLPHRDREGYGFHASAVETLAQRGAKLIITADVGTTAYEAVERAKALGVDVIITDHHEVMTKAPEAIAVVNSKLGAYPFPHLCGAGVAFKFVCAALAEGKQRALPEFIAIPAGWEKWLLDVVAISTVADMVPLVGENRVLAFWGLQVLRKSPRSGLRALCDAARIRQSELTEDDIGFSIAPRLNAASRMDEPQLALQILTTGDHDEARMLAKKLEELNAKRKGIVAGMVRQAKRRARERFSAEEKVVVLGDVDWKPALLGLAANSIVQERGGVVCLWGRDAQGNLKGSCRSDGSLSLVDLFGAAPEVFEQYGGHAHSGGFTVSHDRVHTLHEELSRAAGNMHAALVASAEHDISLPLGAITRAHLTEIARLAPFGIGNPKPVFLLEKARVEQVRRFGKTNNHVEVLLMGEGMRFPFRAFEFFKAPEQFTCAPAPGMQTRALCTLERDSFRGGSLCLRLVDIVAAA